MQVGIPVDGIADKNPQKSGSDAESRPSLERNASRGRQGWIDLFRWMCILSVLVHHSLFPSRQSPELQWAILWAKEILSWCVMGFFFASGWLARADNFRLASVIDRAKRLLRPFLTVNLALCAVMFPLARLGLLHASGAEWTVRNVLDRMLFLQGMGPQFYFLPLLFLCGTLAIGSVRVLGAGVASWSWAVIVFLLWWRLGVPEHPYGSDLLVLPAYCSVFALGMGLRDDRRSVGSVLLVVLCLLAGIGLLVAGGGSTVLHTYVAIPLFFLVRRLGTGRKLSVFSRWSSGTLYLWHAPILLSSASILWSRMGLGPAPSYVLALSSTIVACQWIHVLLSRSRFGRWFLL